MTHVVASLGPERIEGLVLCRVGGHRLAVRASEVTSVDAAEPSAPYAGTGFSPAAVAPPDARLLRHHHQRLAVDGLEVHAEPLALLPVPLVLKAAWGGALTGFVEAGGLLWPLVSLAVLCAEPEVVS